LSSASASCTDDMAGMSVYTLMSPTACTTVRAGQRACVDHALTRRPARRRQDQPLPAAAARPTRAHMLAPCRPGAAADAPAPRQALAHASEVRHQHAQPARSAALWLGGGICWLAPSGVGLERPTRRQQQRRRSCACCRAWHLQELGNPWSWP
jgi:hypothetical protein